MGNSGKAEWKKVGKVKEENVLQRAWVTKKGPWRNRDLVRIDYTKLLFDQHIAHTMVHKQCHWLISRYKMVVFEIASLFVYKNLSTVSLIKRHLKTSQREPISNICLVYMCMWLLINSSEANLKVSFVIKANPGSGIWCSQICGQKSNLKWSLPTRLTFFPS